MRSQIPSVTMICCMHIDRSWFPAGCAERGSLVHSWANSYLRSIWNPFTEEKHPKYVGGLKEWFVKNKAKLVLGEERLLNEELGFNGHSDFIGTIEEEDGLGLIDFKTSQASQPWWRIQLAAYMNLFDCNRERLGLDVLEWTASLRVDKEGNTRFEKYSREEMETKYFTKFKTMLDYFYLTQTKSCKGIDTSFLEKVNSIRKETSSNEKKVLANYVRYDTSSAKSLFNQEGE